MITLVKSTCCNPADLFIFKLPLQHINFFDKVCYFKEKFSFCSYLFFDTVKCYRKWLPNERMSPKVGPQSMLPIFFENEFPQILISYLMVSKLPWLHLLPTLLNVTFLGEQLKTQAAVTLTRQLQNPSREKVFSAKYTLRNSRIFFLLGSPMSKERFERRSWWITGHE